jgi:hypothetical protein
MTGREIIKRVLEFDSPPRIGYNFNKPNSSDMVFGGFWNISENKYWQWGKYPELLEKVPGFDGEVCMSNGNILGRLNGKTKGECIKGALEDGWETLDGYIKTYLDSYRDPKNYMLDNLTQWASDNKDMFRMASVIALQATIRDTRTIGNMFSDTVLEKENLKRLVNECADIAVAQVDMLGKCGIDSAVIADDWGLQNSLYINPKSWREIWKEPYARVIARLHAHGMKFLLHSCGYIYDIIDDFVEIGADAFQFDQTVIYDFDNLAKKINGKATLWSPVDIQKILPTGDKEKIQKEALRMIRTFHKGGGLIAKDYPSLGDIGVKDEWAQYARDVFMAF